jgi:hypothetical protein
MNPHSLASKIWTIALICLPLVIIVSWIGIWMGWIK